MDQTDYLKRREAFMAHYRATLLGLLVGGYAMPRGQLSAQAVGEALLRAQKQSEALLAEIFGVLVREP